MKIAIASDHGGFELKESIKKHLEEVGGYEITDYGTYTSESVDYAAIAYKVGMAVTEEKILGILCCGTGIGISMAANKVKGVRAACCSDYFSAKLTRAHNDANILCLGGRTIGEWEAIDILETFLNTEYDGMFHDGSLNLIREAEEYMMNDNVWQEEPRKISTGPLADAEIFDRSKG